MKRLTLVIIAVSLAVGLFVQIDNDFRIFYAAGRALLSGDNVYAVSGYYSPLNVAIMAAPLSLLPYELAARFNAALGLMAYCAAMWRIFNRRVLWLALLAPFGVLVAWYGNIDSLVLLGATLPNMAGVWLMLLKPQMGLIGALILLYKRRDWLTGALVAATFGLSIRAGWLQSSPVNEIWNFSLFPFGLLIGLPLAWAAWRKRDALIGLGAAVFISPYVSVISWIAAMPLFKANRRLMAFGLALSWALFIAWIIRVNL